MRISNRRSGKRRARTGLSLIELGMVMVFVSLALVPVVKMIGGPTSAEGNVSRVTGLKSKEAVLANTMVERVISADFTSFDCGGGGTPVPFNPNTDLPTNGGNQTYGTCTDNSYNKPLYYRWTVVHLDQSNNGGNLPDQNNYYQATFNVMDSPTGNAILTLPTYFFYNEGAPSQTVNKTGIMLALDSSGSMEEAAAGTGYKGQISGATIPWMYYRYDPSQWTRSPSKLLNMWDDTQLDLIYGKQIGTISGAPFQYPPDPDNNTAFNEAFPYPGKHGGSLPASGGLLKIGDCTQNPDNAWASDPQLQDIFPSGVWNVATNDIKKNAITAICDKKNNQADWENKINQNLSRFEAARTAALSLLVNMESNPNILPNINMGFINWSAGTTLRVPMEAPVTVGGGLHFRNMREKLLWLNRINQRNPGVNTISTGGGTRIDLAMRASVTELRKNSYNRRIIVLLTDGDPTGGGADNQPAGLVNYARSVGNNEPDPDKQITIFTVGLIEADNTLMNNIANSTPNGQAFVADSITELKPIFEQIAYQAQKIALLNISDRYGITF